MNKIYHPQKSYSPLLARHFCWLWQRIMMIMMMNVWLSDTPSRLLPIEARSVNLRRKMVGKSSAEFHPAHITSSRRRGCPGNCLPLEAFTKSKSVRKLRSPIRCCHLSAVRHFHPRIWHSFIRQSDEVDETHQRTGCSTCCFFRDAESPLCARCLITRVEAIIEANVAGIFVK